MLPVEIVAEILVFAAADSELSNTQRLELCRVCRAGHFAIHSRILFPSIHLNSPSQVHALAATFRTSHLLERIARRVTRSLSIIILTDNDNGKTTPTHPSDNSLYTSIQRQADLEQNLTTPLRLLLSIFTSLDFLHIDMTPAPLDYRLRRTAVLSNKSSTTPPKQTWTWSRPAISHTAHAERRTHDPLSAFRSHLVELVCMQNVLGAGDFVDQLSIFDPISPNPALAHSPTIGQWDRLESLQLLGPRFRLTCSSARTLALGLPRLKRLALVMPNIMPPPSSPSNAGEDDGETADDPEEVGRDLFLRMSPLQILIDTLCPSDTILSPKSASSSVLDNTSPPIFEHLLIVGHDLPNYVGNSTKLRRWIEGLQYRVRRRSPSPTDQEGRYYYVDPDTRLGDPSATANGGWDEEMEEDVRQPQIQLLTARLCHHGENSDGSSSPLSLPSHPLQIARWMLKRTRTNTHWTFGPDHPSRASNVCLRPPVQLNDIEHQTEDVDDALGDGDGEEQMEMEMALASADEVVFLDDEREAVEYTLENFELPITFLAPNPQPTHLAEDGPRSLGVDAAGTTSSAFDGTTPPLLHTFLPHSFGPSRTETEDVGPSTSSTAAPANFGAQQDNHGAYHHQISAGEPDLEYVDAALRSQKTVPGAAEVHIETIHPGHAHGRPDQRGFSRGERQTTTGGGGGGGGGGVGSLASSFASYVSSGWAGAWR
ncbi:hypothetical protein A4X13_0g7172 [Tilletia indica]|uniref:Uncharacterized protein n=1 Tax=Tilletia indica TaxID=43049 RepID=A0A177TES2_9BASI|nr:hypothetical protein A4X13_0g7172 [Tilletia indica]